VLQFHGPLGIQCLKDRQPNAEQNRIDKKVVFVNQVVFDQIGNETSAAVHNHVFALSVFEWCDFGRQVALGQLGVAPFMAFE